MIRQIFINLFVLSVLWGCNYRIQDFDVETSMGGAPNTPPSVTNSLLNVIHNMALPVSLSGTDPEGDSLSYTIISPPANGTLLGSGSTRTYVANSGFLGTDSFTYIASDGKKSYEIGTVSINVKPFSETLEFSGGSTVASIAFFPDNTKFVLGGSQSTSANPSWFVGLYKGPEAEDVSIIENTHTPVPGATMALAMSVAASSSMIVAGGYYTTGGPLNGVLKLYRGENFEEVSTLDTIGPNAYYTHVAIAPDNSFILAGGLDFGQNYWVIKKFSGPDFTNVEVIENGVPLPGATFATMGGLFLAKDGKSFVTGGTVQIPGSRPWLVKRYSGSNFSQVDILDNEDVTGNMSGLAISENGRTIVSTGRKQNGSGNYLLYVKTYTDDDNDGVFQTTALDHTYGTSVNSSLAALTSDGSTILIGIQDMVSARSQWTLLKYSGAGHATRTILENLSSGTEHYNLNSLAISPNNRFFFSGGYILEGTTHTWLLRSQSLAP